MKKTNAMRILDKEKIHYQSYEYVAEDGHIDGISVADKINKPYEMVYKTLIGEGASKENYCFIIPCHRELDLKKAAIHTGEKSIQMIKVKDINQITGYIRGGCSPIGLKKPLKSFIDESINQMGQIIVSGGKIGVQIEVSKEDLIGLLGILIKDIVKEL